MRLIDEEYMKHPWLGVPRMTTWLRKDMNILVNKKRTERLYHLRDFLLLDLNLILQKEVKERIITCFLICLKNLT